MRNIYRFLTDHRIGDEENFFGVHSIAGFFQFLHQLFVDLQTACGIVNDHIETILFGVFVTVLDDFNRVAFAFVVNRNANRFAENLQLFNSCGAVNVSGDEERFLLPLTAQVEGNFCSKSRLARTLQTDHHNADRRLPSEGEFFRFAAHHLHQFIVDDFHNLLSRRHRSQHFLAHRFFFDRFHKIAGHVKAYVGFEESAAHFAERIRYVFFG